METSLEDRIRERAYHLWNAGGQIHGQAEQHWLTAEREVLVQLTAETRLSQSITPTKIIRQRRPVTNIQPQRQRKRTKRADAAEHDLPASCD
jgi:hypothetical protein